MYLGCAGFFFFIVFLVFFCICNLMLMNHVFMPVAYAPHSICLYQNQLHISFFYFLNPQYCIHIYLGIVLWNVSLINAFLFCMFVDVFRLSQMFGSWVTSIKIDLFWGETKGQACIWRMRVDNPDCAQIQLAFAPLQGCRTVFSKSLRYFSSKRHLKNLRSSSIYQADATGFLIFQPWKVSALLDLQTTTGIHMLCASD